MEASVRTWCLVRRHREGVLPCSAMLAVNLNVSQSHRQLSSDRNPPSVIVCQLFQVIRTVGTFCILIYLYFAKLWFPLVDMRGRMATHALVVAAVFKFSSLCCVFGHLKRLLPTLFTLPECTLCNILSRLYHVPRICLDDSDLPCFSKGGLISAT